MGERIKGMIHGRLKCPNCSQELELSATKAPAMQSSDGSTASHDVDELLGMINVTELNEAESKFVSDVSIRLAQYGERIRMSDKQMAWLRKLANV